MKIKFLSGLVAFLMLMSNFTVLAIEDIDPSQVLVVQDDANLEFVEEMDADSEEELLPMMAAACAIPQRAYDMYYYILAGNDLGIYEYHEYGNTTFPFLPKITGVTYTTFHMSGSSRLVIGSNGTAYYTPNHYSSWYKLNV